jgi:EmrB/QacA subfamily drug resistance transporter
MTRIDAPPRTSRWAALAVLSGGALMIVIDQTIVSVALPFIKTDLGFSDSGLAWVVNAYVTPFGGLLLLVGRLGDLFGRKRMFISGMAVFTAASLACGLATAAPALIAARFFQGIGGAMSSAVVLGMLVPLFPLAADRAKAIGVFSFVQAAGGSLGSLLGGVFTQALSWHWIFLINLPIGVATVALAFRLLDADQARGGDRSADLLGGLLVTTGLMAAVYTLVSTADHGFASGHTVVFGAAAVGLLIAFGVREANTAEPLLPLRMFRSRTVSVANLTQALLIAGMFAFLFFGALFLQESLQYDALHTGLGMIPVAVAIGAVSLGLSARLNTRFGERPILLAGLALITLGLALLGRAPIDSTFVVDLLPAMLLIGVGFGAAMPALMALGMSGATDQDAGLAAGLFSTSQQIGGALGLAVLAALAATRTDKLSAAGEAQIAALTGGYHLAFAVAASLALASLLIAAVMLPRNISSVSSQP